MIVEKKLKYFIFVALINIPMNVVSVTLCVCGKTCCNCDNKCPYYTDSIKTYFKLHVRLLTRNMNKTKVFNRRWLGDAYGRTPPCWSDAWSYWRAASECSSCSTIRSADPTHPCLSWRQTFRFTGGQPIYNHKDYCRTVEIILPPKIELYYVSHKSSDMYLSRGN